MSTFPTATGNAVIRAYSRASKRVVKENLLAASDSAGFIIPDGQKKGEREGYQVFVRVVRFSEKKLKKNPISGGLLGRC